MSKSNATATYEQLADMYERRGEARQRDLFLALSADAALQAGRPDQAERNRQRLLQVSPYHLLRPYPTFADSLQSPDVVDYLTDLRNQFPPDRAAQLLDGLKANTPAGAAAAGVPLTPLPAETLAGSSGRPPAAVPMNPPRRRVAASPYEERSAAPRSSAVSEGPTLTWAPELLFLIVLLLGLCWAAYVFVGPFFI